MEHKNYSGVYIGKLIQEKVDESHMPYAEFARLIHCSRTNLYRMFACKSIDVERLLLISEVLQYDFIHSVYLSETESKSRAEESGILLPFRNGHVCLDGLPDYIRRDIKDSL